MKGIVLVPATLAVFGLGFWAYQENYRTQDVLAQVEDLNARIGSAHARLRVLNAEWAYLNRPDRLADLVNANFARLELLPMAPESFGQVDQVAMPPEVLPPILNAIDPVDIAFETDPNVEPL